MANWRDDLKELNRTLVANLASTSSEYYGGGTPAGKVLADDLTQEQNNFMKTMMQDLIQELEEALGNASMPFDNAKEFLAVKERWLSS